MPKIKVTESAQRAIKKASAENDDLPLRVDINSAFDHQLFFEERKRLDEELYVGGGVTLIFDVDTAQRADGMSIDFVETSAGAGFRIDNPNAPPKIKQLPPEELKMMFDSGQTFELVDVRTEEERSLASLPNSRLLDQKYIDELLTRDRNTTLIFQCHHGMRSQSAAEYFLGQGFRNIYNLRGGIDAWSLSVDASVPRY